MRDDEVTRQPDAGELDARPARDLDVDDGEQDRQPAAPHEDDVEHGVVRVVVALPVAGEAVDAAEQLPDRAHLRVRAAVRAGHGLGELGAERVQGGQRTVRVDVAELRGEREHEQVQTRIRLARELAEGRQAGHADHCGPRGRSPAGSQDDHCRVRRNPRTLRPRAARPLPRRPAGRI